MSEGANKKQALLFLVLSLILMVIIFAFSNQAYSGRITEAYLGDANVPVRKMGHVSEFALLSFLYFRTIVASGYLAAAKSWQQAGLALFLAFLYACSDEWHQSFVPGRSSSFSDVMVDTSGMVVAMLITLLVIWRRKKDPSARLQ